MADKILIVDDDPAICKLLEKVMHSNELETTTVNCGMDALSILKNHTFDLILMDIMLGDMEGFEVIKIFKKCRLILCSKRRKQRKSMNNIRNKCIIIHKNDKKEKEGVDGLKKNC